MARVTRCPIHRATLNNDAGTFDTPRAQVRLSTSAPLNTDTLATSHPQPCSLQGLKHHETLTTATTVNSAWPHQQLQHLIPQVNLQGVAG